MSPLNFEYQVEWHRNSYTLIETAKLNGIDPNAWLADTIARIPDNKITKADDLLPWHWNTWRSHRTVTNWGSSMVDVMSAVLTQSSVSV